MTAAAILGMSAAAYADAPSSLSPLRVTPQSSAPQGTIVIAGGGCVGSGGTVGTVLISLQNPDGSTHTERVSSLDASGGWAQQFSAPATPGTYAVTASCDLYSHTIGYPAAAITVAADGVSDGPDGGAGSGGPGPSGGTPERGSPDGEDAEPGVPESGIPAPLPNPGKYPVAESPAGLGNPNFDLASTGTPLGGLPGIAFALVASGMATAVASRRPRT